MKNIKNKKILLLILTIILFLTIFINFLRFKELNSESFVTDNAKTEDLFFKAKKDKIAAAENLKTTVDNELLQSSKNNLKNNKLAKEEAVKRIALISEIKDPFKKEERLNYKLDSQRNESEKLLKKEAAAKIDRTQNEQLLLLEKSVFNNNSQAKKLKKSRDIEEKVNNDKDDYLKNRELKNEAEQLENIKNINLPFKMLGIIKNKNKAAVLFLYKGKKIVKREGDKIDLFQIDKINNKKIVLNYKDQKRILKLWED